MKRLPKPTVWAVTSMKFSEIASRLTDISTPLVGVSWQPSELEVSAARRVIALTRPNGVNTAYSYDSLSRLLSVLHQSGGTTVDGATYTTDNAGNRTTKLNGLSGITDTYSYDAIYQLTQVTQGGNTTESYGFDRVGNRLSSLGLSPYSYNNSNQLTSTPNATFTYDNNGNMVSKSDASGTTQYAWEYENRLTSVILSGGAGTVTFKYDPFGRRIQKIGPNGTTNYLYDGANAIEEVDQNGNVFARYTQGPGIDQPLSELRSGTTSYYQQDALSSVTSLSNSAGALADTYTYDSYGKLTTSTGTVTNPFQYTGRELDAETGTYEYRARYYDPSIGRFISEDPIRFKGGTNFYSYVANDPIGHEDPLGLTPECKPKDRKSCSDQYQQCLSAAASNATTCGKAVIAGFGELQLPGLACIGTGPGFGVCITVVETNAAVFAAIGGAACASSYYDVKAQCANQLANCSSAQ